MKNLTKNTTNCLHSHSVHEVVEWPKYIGKCGDNNALGREEASWGLNIGL